MCRYRLWLGNAVVKTIEDPKHGGSAYILPIVREMNKEKVSVDGVDIFFEPYQVGPDFVMSDKTGQFVEVKAKEAVNV